MAETLGSLTDKLTIKSLRQFHLKEMLKSKDKIFPARDLKKKLRLVELQKKDLMQEINNFIIAAAQGRVKIKGYADPPATPRPWT